MSVEQGRNADILQSIVDDVQYTDPPQSRIEDLLLQVKEVIEENSDNISDIQSIIPSDASAQNPLATIHDVTEENIKSSSSSSPVTDSADGMVQGVTVKGKSRKTKNLFNITNPSKTQNGITFTVSADGTITVTGTATSMTTYFTTATPLNVLVQGESYVLSGCPANGGISSYQIDLYATGGYDLSRYVADIGNTTTFTAVDTELSPCRIRIASGYACPTGGLIFKPMICTAADYEADPTFEPYFEGIKSVGDDGLTVTTANGDNTLTTSAVFATALPLRGVSDTVRDKLTCTAEKKQVETVCGSVKGSDLTWQKISNRDNQFAAQISDKKVGVGSNSIICSDYVTSNSEAQADKSIWAEYAYHNNDIVIHDSSYSDATTFAAAIADMEIIYSLATPTEIPLTDAEISSFRSLRTYDSTTNITISDEPEFEIDYLKNTENGQAVADIQRDLQGQIDALRG